MNKRLRKKCERGEFVPLAFDMAIVPVAGSDDRRLWGAITDAVERRLCIHWGTTPAPTTVPSAWTLTVARCACKGCVKRARRSGLPHHAQLTVEVRDAILAEVAASPDVTSVKAGDLVRIAVEDRL